MLDECKRPLRRFSATGLLVAFGFCAAAALAKGQPPDTCPVTLFPNPEYCVSKRPLSVATADLNGDGILDLATALQFGPIGHTLGVLFGNGDGTFGEPMTYEGGFEPFDVVIGDLDDDGDLDLVVACAGGHLQPGAILIKLNAGDGTFPSQMIHGVGIDPKSVALGDLDGDGDLDIAVAVTESNVVTTFHNNGDGTFVFSANYPADMPQAIAIADLNGDGARDFVTANWPQDVVSVRLNNGDGTFGSSVTYDSGTRPASVAIGDLDGDGDADLVVGNAGTTADHGTTVSVLYNNGNGTFSAPLPFDVGEFPTCVLLVDLDGDDDLDLAVTNLWSDDLSVLLNTGDGTFDDQMAISTGSGPYAVASGDFDGDGDLDLAAANCFGDTLSVLPNHGDGTFPDVAYFGIEQPRFAATGDLDGDGDLDLAVTTAPTSRTPGGVSILLNDGEAFFGDEISHEAGYSPTAVAIDDLDGDTDLDLAVANELQSTVSILLNNGDGSFANQATYDVGGGPMSLAIGDLDGDGDADVAVANSGSGNVSILLNNGDGTFADDMTVQVGGGDFSVPFSIALGDVDGDGDLDFATANLKPFNVSILFNNGDGTFAGEVTYPFFVPQSVAFGDLDGDGDLELIVANQFIWILPNDGDGSFGEPVPYESCFGAFFVTTADMNGDGDLDVVVTDRSNTVGVLLNNGNGTFADIKLFRVGSEPLQVVVGDLNGDGALDLVATNFASGSVSILLNSSANSSGDLDDDCDVDLLDFAGFADCMSGPGGGVSVGCEPLDFESDGDVDMDDFHVFQRTFSGG